VFEEEYWMSDYSWVGVAVGRKGTRFVLYSFVGTT